MTPRPRCSAYLATSLDGFIARSDHGLDWLEPMHQHGEDYGFAAFFETVDVLLIGRNTWEVVRGFDPWPYAGKRCIVLTSRAAAGVQGETFYSGDAHPLLGRLAGEGVRHAYVDGGATVTRFLAAGLIDDLTVSVIPVLLGSGIRLFQEGFREQALELTASRSFPSGLVQSSYRLIPG